MVIGRACPVACPSGNTQVVWLSCGDTARCIAVKMPAGCLRQKAIVMAPKTLEEMFAPGNSAALTQVLDTYFLEVRARLIEVAATLDRIDRHPGAAAIKNDPRMAFIHGALDILAGAGPHRAQSIQELYSLK